eukprot:276597-Amorphochlora_amoeboformis.AAC.1
MAVLILKVPRSTTLESLACHIVTVASEAKVKVVSSPAGGRERQRVPRRERERTREFGNFGLWLVFKVPNSKSEGMSRGGLGGHVHIYVCDGRETDM